MNTGYEVLGKTGDSIYNVSTDAAVTQPASGVTVDLFDTTKIRTRTASAVGRGQRRKRLILNLYSSHLSAASGVTFEESDDGGSNWRVKNRRFLPATTRRRFVFRPTAPEWRVRFANSANTLTAFQWSLLADDDDDTAEPQSIRSGDAPTFTAGAAALVSSGTSNATAVPLSYLWHPDTVTKTVEVLAYTVSWAAGAGGTAGNLKFIYASADHGTPNGTSETFAACDGDDELPTGVTFRTAHSNRPTTSTVLHTEAVGFAAAGSYTFSAVDWNNGKPFRLRGGVAEGIECVLTTGATGPSTAAGFATSVKITADD